LRGGEICGARSAERGARSAERGARSAERGARSAEQELIFIFLTAYEFNFYLSIITHDYVLIYINNNFLFLETKLLI
jgi:hypothetical protein